MRASPRAAAFNRRAAALERPGLTSDERARLEALERENRELRQGEEDQGNVPWTFPRRTRSAARRALFSLRRGSSSSSLSATHEET